jgi:hypothetical protein
MTKQMRGAALTAVLALLFVAIEWLYAIRTGIAGVFVMGIAAGLLLGERMAPSTPRGRGA